jgi:hypothetical protein
MLIPVKAPIGGCLIISDERVTYSNGRTSRTKDIKRAPMCAYTVVDANRVLLGDSYGSLSVLTLTADSNHQVVALSTDVLGQISPPTALAYLDSGVAYVGSASGDAQLIRLLSEPQNNQFVEVLDTFTNLGPIQDMAVIDLDRQGQSQVLTCSGTQSSGSLRLISSGVAIDVQAEVGLEVCLIIMIQSFTRRLVYLFFSFFPFEFRVFVARGRCAVTLLTSTTHTWSRHSVPKHASCRFNRLTTTVNSWASAPSLALIAAPLHCAARMWPMICSSRSLPAPFV